MCMSGGVGVVLCPGTVHSCHFIGCVCVGGEGTRVARVGVRCAVVLLASEWHRPRVVCAVSMLHMVLKVAPSSCLRS